MTISAISLAGVTAVAPTTTMLDALEIMFERAINHIAVIEQGKFVGVVAVSDILRIVVPSSAGLPGGLDDLTFAGDALGILHTNMQKLGGIRIADIALQETPVLASTCPLLEAALVLSQNKGPLPVVAPDGKLLGMLSTRAFLKHVFQMLERTS